MAVVAAGINWQFNNTGNSTKLAIQQNASTESGGSTKLEIQGSLSVSFWQSHPHLLRAYSACTPSDQLRVHLCCITEQRSSRSYSILYSPPWGREAFVSSCFATFSFLGYARIGAFIACALCLGVATVFSLK